MDSIRQCEGVAKLLQSHNSKDVAVKPAMGNNKVSPGEVPTEDSAPVTQVLEAIRIMEEGTLTSVGDGNIGSIMGIGFPPHTGGVYQCVNAYGVEAFAERARELAGKYGESFEPPQLLLDMAAEGRVFA